MKTRILGRTGLAVSELALGGLFLASWFATPEQSAATVRRAVELGVNSIDTAPGYGNSEEALGHALRALGGAAAPLILSTKLGGRPQPFNPQDKAALHRSVEESLRLLGRDQIDILMIHEPDRPGQYDWWSDWERFTGPVLEVLDELKRSRRHPLHRAGRHHGLQAAAHHRHRPLRRGADGVQLQPALARGGDRGAAGRQGAGHGRHHRLAAAAGRAGAALRRPGERTARAGSARRGASSTRRSTPSWTRSACRSPRPACASSSPIPTSPAR